MNYLSDKLLGIYAGLLARRAARMDDEGATAVEYGIMVALIAAVIVIVVQTLGTQIKAAFCTVVGALGGGAGC
jgi:pilus assembly protein Flp/PilA